MNRNIIVMSLVMLCAIHTSKAQSVEQGVIVTNEPTDWVEEGRITERVPTFAIKTNLLFDALSIANIEVEVPMYSHWSVCAEWIFPWWYNPSRQRCTELVSGELQGRYWFNHHTELHNLDGWFVGGYVMAGHYDLERRWKGVQGRMWGGGVSGGYAHGVWRNLRLEYSLGLGIVHTNYDKYNAVRDCQDELRLLRYAHGTYNFWGITKAEVSLVWMLNIVKRE